ncbi:MAG: phytanoyl-CoA dioxygenase family protein [Rhodospirillales bacterium]|nr:phytanoyl-CoA dioxygenase family protein [Rhodospirillales bacterium]MDE0377994.1 phytanoyl-CoA dioxygenase family protein [Rhodospirillales bacterium]
MLNEEILAERPRVLTADQRAFYFRHGYLLLERFIGTAWLDRLHAVTESFVEASRTATADDGAFDLAPGHTPARPRLRRVNTPDQRHDAYWEFATGPVADVAADLVGSNVSFHHSKLNFKWNDGADGVTWHQDIPFYPHSNYSPLTIGLYLADTAMAHGPVAVIDGSHEGPLYDHYDAAGHWAGCLSEADVASLDMAKARYLTAPAGSLTVHNCRTVHGSPPSESDDGRPLLLNAYASADATPYAGLDPPAQSVHGGEIVRGAPVAVPHVDPRPCPMPPRWDGRNTSIYANQRGEHRMARPDE